MLKGAGTETVKLRTRRSKHELKVLHTPQELRGAAELDYDFHVGVWQYEKKSFTYRLLYSLVRKKIFGSIQLKIQLNLPRIVPCCSRHKVAAVHVNRHFPFCVKCYVSNLSLCSFCLVYVDCHVIS